MTPVWSQNHSKYQTFAALISSLWVLQRVWKPKKPKQCDCLSGSGYLPPIPSRRPKASWRTQMLPHSFHRTTLPKRPGVTVSTAHWTHWRCPEEKGQAWARPLASLIQQKRRTRGYSVSEESSVFSPEGAWRHTETAQETTASLSGRGHMITWFSPLV